MISFGSVAYFERQRRCAPAVLDVERREGAGGIDGEFRGPSPTVGYFAPPP